MEKYCRLYHEGGDEFILLLLTDTKLNLLLIYIYFVESGRENSVAFKLKYSKIVSCFRSSPEPTEQRNRFY